MPTADRILAVTFTVLLVLSMITPAALAAEPAAAVPAADGTTDVSPPSPDGGDDSTFDENKSSLELRFEARELLRNASIRGGPNANQRLVERVNDSMEHYTGLNRADHVRIFDRDTQVIARAKKTAPEVSNRLLASQARLAETTMADANRTVNRLEEQGGDFNVRRARNQLDQAQRQFEVGEERRADGQPNAAIAGYRQAFIRSHRLIDRLNRRTDPQVEITRRADPIRNGTANYTLEGRVFAVRSSTLQNLTVTVDGDDQTVSLPSSPAPAVTIPFSTTVELENGSTTIEVTAETQSDRGNRIVGSDTATLRLDGDGLSDRTELELTETDPLDSDSDAAVTNIDESDNGTVDGREDFDGDRIATVVEIRRGLDPMSADTDDDHLDDRPELRFPETNATNPDTDGDGILDGAEDPDGDGLNTSREFEVGSHPNATDGDRDGLTDPEELDLGTEPLLADSDDDRLADGEELDLGTDPLDRDTDDDGVIDGNETFSTSVSNDSLNASVTFTGPGDVAGGASVTNETTLGLRNDLVDPARATELIRLDAQHSFETATVNFTYDESVVPTNETDLAVYRLNRTAQFYEPIDSAVDAKNNTVTGRANQTGTYTVLSPSVLDDQFSVDPNEDATHHADTFDEPADCEGECGVNDGSLVVGPLGETSGAKGTAQRSSSSNTDGGFGLMSTFSYPVRTVTTPEDATEMTVSATISGNAAETSSVSFRAGGTTIYTIGSGSVSNRRVSETISVSGGESIELQVSGRSPASMDVDALSISYNTDGGGDGGGTPVDLCQTVPGDQGRECPDSAVSVYSIPITRSVENVTIRGSGSATVIEDNSEVSVEVGGVEDDVLASKTSDGSLSFSKTYRDLSPSADSNELTLSIETTGLAGARLDGVTIWKDTDGDGFTDRRERIGFDTGYYGNIPTDPFDPDTDGDGLEDGEEVGELVRMSGNFKLSGQTQSYQNDFYSLTSNPTDPDTDSDGLNDSMEVNGWDVNVVNRSSEIYRWYSGDPLKPSEQNGTAHFTSDPLFTDTDLDGLTDREEKELSHTDPESEVTYEITQVHQREIRNMVAAFRDSTGPGHPFEDDEEVRMSLEKMGLLPLDSDGAADIAALQNHRFTDRTDDFDFVWADYADSADYDVDPLGGFDFRALDGNRRTDTWLSNDYEVSDPDLDPWDPDTDDDGLTDGQEVRGLISLPGADGTGSNSPIEIDNLGTRADDPDSDSDGWWDGWIGVYDVGRSDNVILYMENIDDGISGHEVVQAQTGVHDETEAPLARGTDVDNDKFDEHSNLHLGEKYWGTDPTSSNDDPSDETTLEIEVDYMSGHDPTSIRSQNGQTVLETTEDNYRLYGLDVQFTVDDQISESELENICTRGHPPACTNYISAGSFNRYELDEIEDEYHDDSSTMHLFWGTELGEDSPGTVVDHGMELKGVDYASADGMAFNNGAPGTEKWEENSFNDFGIFISDSGVNAFDFGQTLVMHEIGHTLGIGYADDDAIEIAGFGIIENGYEAYSGDVNGVFEGVDETPELVARNGDEEWSIMMRGTADSHGNYQNLGNRFAFSIEEISTVDFDDIPSK